jgi:hypothetical protein
MVACDGCMSQLFNGRVAEVVCKAAFCFLLAGNGRVSVHSFSALKRNKNVNNLIN